MTISATGIVVPVCSKTPLLYLLTQKAAQKFGYVLGIRRNIHRNKTLRFYHKSFVFPNKSSIFADMKQEIIDKINRLASQDEPFLFVINYQGDKKVSLFNAMIDFGEREITEILPPDSAD